MLPQNFNAHVLNLWRGNNYRKHHFELISGIKMRPTFNVMLSCHKLIQTTVLVSPLNLDDVLVRKALPNQLILPPVTQ